MHQTLWIEDYVGHHSPCWYSRRENRDTENENKNTSYQLYVKYDVSAICVSFTFDAVTMTM